MTALESQTAHLPTVPRLANPVSYQGRREPQYFEGRQVRTEARAFVARPGHIAPLRLRHDVYNRSEGHEWGYCGAGPGQLAMDILLDMFQDKIFALRYHTAFDQALALRTPHMEEWDLTGSDILAMIEAINQDKGWGPLDPDSAEYKRLAQS